MMRIGIWFNMGWVMGLFLPLLAGAQEESLLNTVGVQSVEAVSGSHVLLVASGSAGNSDAVQLASGAARQDKSDTEVDKPAGARVKVDKPAEETGTKENKEAEVDKPAEQIGTTEVDTSPDTPEEFTRPDSVETY